MPRSRKSPSEDPQPRRRTATTPDDREAQMIDLADQLAERQLREGIASSQVITHYLKLGSTRERKEQRKLELEMDLLVAKKESIESAVRQEELFAKAIKAIGAYRGEPALESDNEDFQ